jgi:Uma2 family endonuclease
MATVPSTDKPRKYDYPTSDGKPMAETDFHRELMIALIHTLMDFYAQQRVYVSGNLLLYYEPGNRRRHVSPDVFVVKGVPNRQRLYYLTWEEGKTPDVVIELTSSSTRREDVQSKFRLYQDTLHVKEYFLFDPFEEYLTPSMRGYRLRQGVYQPIRPITGRLPSQVLRLHLERHGAELRLFDPRTAQWLPTREEKLIQEAAARQQEAAARQQEAAARRAAEAEVERLRQELERLRRRNHRDS